MKDFQSDVQLLSDTLIYEIVNAAGLPKRRGWFNLFRLFFRKPAARMAEIGLTLDRDIAEYGVVAATGRALTNWTRHIHTRGRETIPVDGPLLVTANHAGAYDSFVICSQLGRRDFKVISSDIAFLKNLPHVLDHTIFLTYKTQDRSAAARAGIRHLKQGGALLIFGTGLIDPDPAVFPGAALHLERWSASINLFLRAIPEARLVNTIVSGVVSERWAHHPVTWLRRIDWQKRRIAEFSQVIQQLFFPGRLFLEPCISFARPESSDDLRREAGGRELLPVVIAHAKELLKEHCRIFNCRAD